MSEQSISSHDLKIIFSEFEKELRKKIRRRVGIIGEIIWVIGSVTLGLLAISYLVYLGDIPSTNIIRNTFFIILALTFLGSSFAGVRFDIAYLKKNIRLLDMLNTLSENKDNIQRDINTVLVSVKNIYSIIKNLIWYKKIIAFLDYEGIDVNNLVMKEVRFCLQELGKIRENITYIADEQQKSLESAKSEVEKNIGGITELEQVSEFQKVRLDRQIEQFEELQGVLVNM